MAVMHRAIPCLRLVGVLLLVAEPAGAQVVALDGDAPIDEPREGWLPYVFSAESMGFTAGVVAFSSGRFQPQTTLSGTVFGSTNESWGAVLSSSDLRVRGTERLFFDGFLMAGHFTDSRYYVDLDNDPGEPPAGSNDSDPDDFVTGVSNSLQLDLTLKVPLPIGNAVDDPVSVYRLDRGLRRSGPVGGESWNPLKSGKTTVSATFFLHNRDLLDDVGGDLLIANSNGLEVGLDHDNTDFPRNPSHGSRQRFLVTRDFGWANSDNSWTNLQAELSKYFSLGTSDWFRQQVLAFNFWTSNSPTWEKGPSGSAAKNRPPPYLGSRLGGFDRLRAYPTGRFNDKSAVYYTAELRMTPEGNPLREAPLLDYFAIDWVQLVGFVEAGRVGPDYTRELFFEDLKLSAGLDLRLMAHRRVFRVGLAWSEEGSQIWAMFGQPFSRSSLQR